MGATGADEGLGCGGAVRHIHHSPAAVQPFPVGPAKTGGSAVVHVHHAPTAAGPVLNRQAEATAGHGCRAAVAFHQQRRWCGWLSLGRVVPGVGALAGMTGEPDRFRHADVGLGDRRLHRRGVDPGAWGCWRQGQFQQPGHGAAVAGYCNGATVEGPQPGQVVEGLIDVGDRAVQAQALERPAAIATGCSEKLFPIPGCCAHAVDPLRHRGFRRHWPGVLPGGAPRSPSLEVPPTLAVLRHQQRSVRQPLGLEHRHPCTASNRSGSTQFTGWAEIGAPQFTALPGHGRLLPFHPGQLCAIRTETAIAGEVRRLMPQLRLLSRCIQVGAH